MPAPVLLRWPSPPRSPLPRQLHVRVGLLASLARIASIKVSAAVTLRQPCLPTPRRHRSVIQGSPPSSLLLRRMIKYQMREASFYQVLFALSVDVIFVVDLLGADDRAAELPFYRRRLSQTLPTEREPALPKLSGAGFSGDSSPPTRVFYNSPPTSPKISRCRRGVVVSNATNRARACAAASPILHCCSVLLCAAIVPASTAIETDQKLMDSNSKWTEEVRRRAKELAETCGKALE